jgi:hypothetical protein
MRVCLKETYPTAALMLLKVYEPALVCTLVAIVLDTGGLMCSLTSSMAKDVGSELNG